MDRRSRLKLWFDSHPVNQDSIGTHQIEKDGIKSLLAVISSKDGKALDVACGSGAYTFLLAEQGLTVIGIDISPVCISELRKSPLSRNLKISAVEVEDGRNLPFQDCSFDVITCIGMLEYYPFDEKMTFISEMVRLLAPDGWLIFDIPLRGHHKTIEFTQMERSIGNDIFPESSEKIQNCLQGLGCDLLKVQICGFEQQFLFKKLK